MTQKNGRKEKTKCPDTNIPVSTAENLFPQTTTYALTAAKLTPWGHNDAPNVKTQPKRGKLDAAAVVSRCK